MLATGTQGCGLHGRVGSCGIQQVVILPVYRPVSTPHSVTAQWCLLNRWNEMAECSMCPGCFWPAAEHEWTGQLRGGVVVSNSHLLNRQLNPLHLTRLWQQKKNCQCVGETFWGLLFNFFLLNLKQQSVIVKEEVNCPSCCRDPCTLLHWWHSPCLAF